MRFTRFARNASRAVCAACLLIALSLTERVQGQPRQDTFPMPSVIGLTVEAAEQRVQNAGVNAGAFSARALVVGQRTDSRPAGQIIEQRERVGQAMRPYRDDVGGVYGQVQFSVVLSTGPPAPTTFRMPNIVGMTVADAERAVFNAGRAAGTRRARATVVGERTDARPAGQVIQQLEAPGQPMRPYGDDVGGNYGEVGFRVVVSAGPALAPDYIGQALERVMALALRQRIDLSVADRVRNPVSPPGVIVRQEPPPGQPMTRNQVRVWPSAGFPLPDYVGRPVADALREGERLGFTLAQQVEENPEVPRGVIIEQRPQPGTLLPMNGPLSVRVSSGWPLPDFVGMPESQAREIAARFRFQLASTARDNPTVPTGIIVGQQPPAGAQLPANRVVGIEVSSGYPLPDLVGRPIADARGLAGELGLRLDESTNAMPERPAGQVAGQDPAPGTLLPLQGPVRVVVSEGWPTPDFIALDEARANALAAERRVSAAVTGRREDRDAEPGIVVDQDPAPGSLLPPGQTVSLVLSSGYPTPQLVGLEESDARSLAGRDGITLAVTTDASVDHAAGIVSDQSPAPGEPLPADERVAVTVSSGWPTPNFVGKTGTAAGEVAAEFRITLAESDAIEHYDWAEGLVATQQPPAGTVLPPDRRVTIAYSLGWPVAPEAVDLAAGDVSEPFVGRYPNATVAVSESWVTFKPPGTVISQRPAANVKLDPQQRLFLVVATEKPPWTWATAALVLLVAGAAVIKVARPTPETAAPDSSPRADDLGGIHLRVTRDLGVQSVIDDGEAARDQNDGSSDPAAGDVVEIRVVVDLGTQTMGSADEKGEPE